MTERTITAQDAGQPGPLDRPLAGGEILADRFEVVGRLGVGGAGAVYSARDRLVNEDVAVKILHPRLRARGQLSRLRAEVRVSRRIAHPNVCRIHGLWEHAGVVFLVMELLAGETLRRRLRRRLELPEAVELTRQLGAGLAAAHRAGVIHCDVKPENALLVPHGSDQVRVVLTDFGVARLLGADRTAAIAAWRAEGGHAAAPAIEGTAAYMSPEQFDGQPLDERTDVFSLAAVVYEMLSGSPPFAGPSSLSLAEVAARVRRSSPSLPAESLARLGDHARARTSAVVSRGMAREPKGRFDTVDAFVTSFIAAVGISAGSAFSPSPVRFQSTAPSGPQDAPSPNPSLSSSDLATSLSAPPRPSPAHPPAGRTSRRLVTAVHLAVDVAGDDGGDEEVIDRADAIRAAAELAFLDAGGAVVGRAPGIVMAVFGAHTSTGDEPQRAADTAAAIVKVADPTDAVRMRAGLDSGRLLVRTGPPGTDPSISGAVLARAGALARLGRPGEVVASARVSRHLRRRYRLTPASDNEASIVVSRLRSSELAIERTAPLIGRSTEIQQLTDEVVGAARDGMPRSALVLGPAGIGKTRVLVELSEQIGSRGGFETVVAAAAPEDALASHALIRQVLSRLLDLGDHPTLSDAWVKIAEAFGADDPADEPLIQPLAALLSGEKVATGAPLLPAVRACFAALAHRRPRLVFIDDFHWADAGSIEVVDALARGEIEAPLALVVLARPELLEHWPRARNMFRLSIDLAALPPDSTRALVAQLLGDQPSHVADALAKTSEGSPFFVQELVGDFLERGEEALGSAGTLEEAIQARFDRLSPRERDVLRRAAALGSTFRRGLLREVLAAQGMEVADLDEVLGSLESRGQVHALPPDEVSDDFWAFEHEILREVAYQELNASARRAIHEAAAAVLQARRSRIRSPEQLLELARHLEGAGTSLEAAAVYRAAGDLSLSQSAPADAARCYRRARRLWGDDADADLLIRWGEAEIQIGEYDEAERVLEEALSKSHDAAGALDTASARRAAARAVHAQAILAKQRGQWEDGVAHARRGLEILGEEDDVLAARLHGALGWFLGYILGDTDAGLSHGLKAVELLEERDQREELARAYGNLGACYMRAGRWREQLRCNERNLEIGEELGSISLLARAHMNLGINLLGLGEPDRAAAHSRESIALHERMCTPTLVALARNNLALALVDLGALEEAERELAEAVRLSDRAGRCYFRYEVEISLSRIAAKRGQLALALEHAKSALSLALADKSPIDEGISRKFVSAMLARSGDLTAAAGELDRAEALLAGTELGEHARVRAERARLLDRLGEADRAAQERAAAREAFESLGAALELEKLSDLEWI